MHHLNNTKHFALILNKITLCLVENSKVHYLNQNLKQQIPTTNRFLCCETYIQVTSVINPNLIPAMERLNVPNALLFQLKSVPNLL